MKHKTRNIRTALAAGLLILTVLGGGYTYLNTGYSADETALAALESGEGVTVTMPGEGLVVFAARVFVHFLAVVRWRQSQLRVRVPLFLCASTLL